MQFLPRLHSFKTPVFVFGLAVLAFGMPTSKVLMSIGQFIMVGSWLLFNDDHIGSIKKFLQNRIAISLTIIFLLHILWLFNTSDLNYALNDIKTKLPLFIIPFVSAGFLPFSKKNLHFVFVAFLSGLFASSMYSLFIYLGLTGVVLHDFRDISPIISHIRLSLMVSIGIFICFYFIITKKLKLPILFFLLMIWFIVFMVMLKSFTVFILLGFVILIIAGKIAFSNPNYWVRICIIVFITGCTISLTSNLYFVMKGFYAKDVTDIRTIQQKTINNNIYNHDFNDKALENGHYIGLFVCWKELSQQWPKRSMLNFDGVDAKGNPIRYTLSRYLTSKGLTKDSMGLSFISSQEIREIEEGVTNYKYGHGIGIKARLYSIMWELNNYHDKGEVSGHTLTMRFAFLKAGWNVFKNHFWLGTGTGDVKLAFQNEYNQKDYRLDDTHQLRAHNQYLTFAISFGIIGLLIFLACVFYPLTEKRLRANYLFVSFYVIALGSMINEDTLESQAGVTFFVFGLTLMGMLDGSNNVDTTA